MANPAWNALLARYPPLGMAPVHSAARIQADAAWQDQLRVQAAVDASAAGTWGVLQRLPDLSTFLRLRFAGDTPRAALMTELRALPTVVRAVRVPRASPPDIALPTDPLIGSPDAGITRDPQSDLGTQWYLHRLRVPQAWRHARGAGTVIADIDWGFQDQPQRYRRCDRVVFDAVSGGTDVSGSRPAHGTAVLGLAGARADGKGICGCAPEAALWAIQASGGAETADAWAAAIEHVRLASANGRRKIILLEVQTEIGGNYEQVPSVQRAVRAAIAAGCVVCVAAGNGGRPADLDDDDAAFRSHRVHPRRCHGLRR